MPGFVSRAGWGARPPKGRSTSINPEGVTVHWGGPSPWRGRGFDHTRCASIARAWQSYHMDARGWWDLGYNALVCPHGYVYEGRWRKTRGAHAGTNEGNYRSYGVCYIAGEGDPLTDAAKLGLKEAARLLGRPIKWSHRDWNPTGCPGDELAAWVAAGTPLPTLTPAPGEPPLPPVPPTEFVRRLLQVIDFCSNGTFAPGDANECVAVLQRVLNHKAGGLNGVPLADDGVYGPNTEQAVRNVQQWVGIAVDGIAGPQTWAALKR